MVDATLKEKETKDVPEVPTQLKSYADLRDWNEWVVIAGAKEKITTERLNGLNKAINSAIKIRMEMPLAYVKLLKTMGQKDIPLQIPWLQEAIAQ